MKHRKKQKSETSNLAIYFGVAIALLFLLALVFKGVELFKGSKFDGKNRFSVAITSKEKMDVITYLPQEKSITRVSIDGAKDFEDIKYLGLPTDAFAKTSSRLDGKPQSEFSKLLIHKRGLKTNLTIVDLINLWLSTRGVGDENVKEESLSIKDTKGIEKAASELLIDPKMSSERVTIQITNTTNSSGLGNRLAKYLTNLGGSVVLVNSSSTEAKESLLISEKKSYSVEKIAELLNLKIEEKDPNSISDVIIILGKDLEDSKVF